MAKRVWDVIEKLDFVPNTQARALVSGRSKLFGLIVSEITNPFFPELIQGFEDIAVEHGYEILVSSTNHDPKRMSHCIRRMLERKVEGVAIMTFGIEEPLLDQLAKRKVPLVFIDVKAPIAPASASSRSTTTTASARPSSIWPPSATATSPSSPDPCACTPRNPASPPSTSRFRSAASSPDPSRIIEGDHTLEGGVIAMEKLLALPNLPTAVSAPTT
jgi:DNA-binding LacI/PurR family transcriptional regulator